MNRNLHRTKKRPEEPPAGDSEDKNNETQKPSNEQEPTQKNPNSNQEIPKQGETKPDDG